MNLLNDFQNVSYNEHVFALIKFKDPMTLYSSVIQDIIGKSKFIEDCTKHKRKTYDLHN
jgi:hypothetical protein